MNTLVTIRNDTGQATSLNRTYLGIMGQLITSLINPDGFEDWGKGEGSQPSHGAHWRRYELIDGRYAVFNTAYDQSSGGYGNDPVINSQCVFVGSLEDSEVFIEEYF